MTKPKITKRELFSNEPLQIREREDGQESRTIVGHAILFNAPSVALYEDEREEVREVILPTAVTQDLLDESDVKMTMFHDRQLILARSNKGKGTLSYKIDEKGVAFEFEAPHTADGDKALELVKRGDIAGCSFAFSTYYRDEEYVSCRTEAVGGKMVSTYSVKRMTGIYDFTLAADPAYPETDCSNRERPDFLTPFTEPKTEEQPQEPPIVDKRDLKSKVAGIKAILRDI